MKIKVFNTKTIVTVLLCQLIAIMLVSCDKQQEQIDELAFEIEEIQTNGDGKLNKGDLLLLEQKIGELEHDIVINREDYTALQVEEFEETKGKFNYILLKQNLKETKETLKNYGNQIEGFLDAMEKDTLNN